MAFARADALTYLAGEWTRYLILAGITATDDPAGIKSVLDRAFRSLGVARADLATASVADADAEGAEALLDAAMVRRLHKALGDLVAVSLGDPNVTKQRQQAWEHLNTMLPVYDAAATAFETVGTGSWAGMTTMSTDTYEPLPAGVLP